MNMRADIIRRFHAALPQVRGWIDQFLDSHADRARAVGTLGFARLSACFPQELLERAKVASVDGITLKDTFSLQQGRASEALHFHELVHVVQLSRLGVDNFLLAYGLGLFSFGYAKSPLEQMAYTLQRGFELGTLPRGLVHVIEQATDAIWNQAAPIVQGPYGGA